MSWISSRLSDLKQWVNDNRPATKGELMTVQETLTAAFAKEKRDIRRKLLIMQDQINKLRGQTLTEEQVASMVADLDSTVVLTPEEEALADQLEAQQNPPESGLGT